MYTYVNRAAANFAGTATQAGANIDTVITLPTGIDPGSSTVIEFISLEVYWRNFSAAVNPTSNGTLFEVGVGRTPVVPSIANTDVFGMVAWVSDSAGTPATATLVADPIFGVNLDPALTVQPFVYLSIHTASLAAAVTIDYKITYQTSKKTDKELLTLIAGAV